MTVGRMDGAPNLFNTRAQHRHDISSLGAALAKRTVPKMLDNFSPPEFYRNYLL
jgi:hypothetical protein